MFYNERYFLEISQNSQACNFIKKETLAQVFSCEFCEISKKAFFTERLWVITSVPTIFRFKDLICTKLIYSWSLEQTANLFVIEKGEKKFCKTQK